jgi:hypothetical protein
MEYIGAQPILSYLDDTAELKPDPDGRVRSGIGLHVTNYMDLAQKIAALQFANPAYLFLFRGQTREFRNKNQNSTLRPGIVRARGTADPSSDQLRDRFDELHEKERQLVELFRNHQLGGQREVERYRIRRWAILQHYEICETPLLDVTSNLRIAATFATDATADWGYIYVLGLPHLGGAITVSAESSIQVLRLASICPPMAMRPHLQDGFLLGEYPDLIDYETKANYAVYEVDFGRRLVAKFRFKPKQFWQASTSFPQIERAALFPDDDDPFYQLVDQSFELKKPAP